MSHEILWEWDLWLYYSPPRFISHEILPLQEKPRALEASGYLGGFSESAPHMVSSLYAESAIQTGRNESRQNYLGQTKRF